jgi:hypothetical protein
VNAVSFFKTRFDSSGIAIYERSDIVYDSERLDFEDCAIEKVDNGIKMVLTIHNNSEIMKIYDIYKITGSKTYLKTERIAPHYEIKSEVIIPAEDISNFPDLSISIERHNYEIGTIFAADLLAKDIRTHWAKSSILILLSKGFIFNRDNNEFKPDKYITRGEFSAFLSNSLKLGMGDTPKAFIDVGMDHKLYEFISKASSNGLINGYQDNTFKPDNNILRQDVAVIIGNAFRYLSLELNSSSSFNDFTDYDQVSSYALDALDKCVANGIITGKPGNILDPLENLTRAEATVIIERVMKILGQIK